MDAARGQAYRDTAGGWRSPHLAGLYKPRTLQAHILNLVAILDMFSRRTATTTSLHELELLITLNICTNL